tara:strand:+ start:3722 stop:4369 length:648 start_codon:yes stop_codon:yes gene_type:complete
MTRLNHDLIVENVAKMFSEHFQTFTEVDATSEYRGCYADIVADVLLYDEMQGFLFGIECKTWEVLNVKNMQEAYEQSLSYNCARFPLPGILSKPLHPHAFFVAAPRMNFATVEKEEELKQMMSVLPGGLGYARIVGNHLELKLCNGTRIWDKELGYHNNVSKILAPRVGSRKVPHQAISVQTGVGKNLCVSSPAQGWKPAPGPNTLYTQSDEKAF